MKIYEALLPEPNDGRGYISGGFFIHDSDARIRAAQGNVCGTPTPGNVRTIEAHESIGAYRAHVYDEERRAALAKLSMREREVLGLK